VLDTIYVAERDHYQQVARRQGYSLERLTAMFVCSAVEQEERSKCRQLEEQQRRLWLHDEDASA
jgi:hypothetical protein